MTTLVQSSVLAYGIPPQLYKAPMGVYLQWMRTLILLLNLIGVEFNWGNFFENLNLGVAGQSRFAYTHAVSQLRKVRGT